MYNPSVDEVPDGCSLFDFKEKVWWRIMVVRWNAGGILEELLLFQASWKVSAVVIICFTVILKSFFTLVLSVEGNVIIVVIVIAIAIVTQFDTIHQVMHYYDDLYGQTKCNSFFHSRKSR